MNHSCGCVSEGSSERDVVHQPCMVCLCAGRTTKTLTDSALFHYYADILRDVSSPEPPRLCWQCEALLRRALHFTKQVRASYVTLHPALLTLDTEDLSACLSVSCVQRLQSHVANSVNIPAEGCDRGYEAAPSHTVMKQEYVHEEPVLTEIKIERVCDDNGEEYDHHEEECNKVDPLPTAKMETTPDDNGAAVQQEQSAASWSYIYLCPTTSAANAQTPGRSGTKHHTDTPTQSGDIYKCTVCPRSFVSQSNLTVHMRTHTGEKPFKCAVCQRSFTMKANWKTHMKTHAATTSESTEKAGEGEGGLNDIEMPTPEKPFKCAVCQKEFLWKRSLNHHMEKHGEKPFECSFCQERFTLKVDFKYHTKTAHIGELKSFKCDVCQKTFKQNVSLKRHMAIHSVAGAAGRPYKCLICENTYSRVTFLGEHITNAHSNEKSFGCPFCQKVYTNCSDLTAHLKTEKPFKCAVCPKGYATDYELTIHTRTHTREKPYKCGVCQQDFSISFQLTVHMRTHTGEQPHKCPVCQKSFKDDKNLKLHHMRMHTQNKPFHCPVCQKDFCASNELKSHMRLHTGEKPYQCAVCQKGFQTSGGREYHMSTHTGETRYECSVCQKGFYTSHSLKVHMRTHTGEKPCKCSVCQKDFASLYSLKTHMRSHTGEKPFLCAHCPKAFRKSQNLVIHMRTHTGEKPHKCAVCQRGFSQRSSLKGHMRTHTGEN